MPLVDKIKTDVRDCIGPTLSFLYWTNVNETSSSFVTLALIDLQAQVRRTVDTNLAQT
jgi:hypothetical protein